MAQQYSAAQPYSTQYSSMFSPFAPAAGQQIGNGTPNYQQMNVHQNLANPSPVSNQMRYDANANVQPQHAPLPFPSPFNPELLKHFPPPPPIPPAHFAIHPGSATNLAQFPTGISTPPVLPQHSYTPFQQPTTPLSGIQSGGHSDAPTQDPRLYGQVAPSTEVQNPVEQISSRIPSSQALADRSSMGPSTGRSMDGRIDKPGVNSQEISHLDRNVMTTTAGGPRSHNTEHQLNKSTQSSHPQHSRSGHQAQTVSRSDDPKVVSQMELKERAKAALLSLVPHNIRYNDFLAEGVDARVLQQLYQELGLSWQSNVVPASRIGLENSKNANQLDGSGISSPKVQSSQQLSSSTKPAVQPIAKVSPAVASLSRPSPTASPSMERKDRIAQLLAAKAGKAASSTAASQSGSPASIPDSVPPNQTEPTNSRQAVAAEETKVLRPATQTEIVRQKTQQLKRDTIPKSKLSGDEHTSNFDIVSSRISQQLDMSRTDQLQTMPLPTPVREQIARNEFASLIPGLFMTADEMEEVNGRDHLREFVSSETSRDPQVATRMNEDATSIVPILDERSPRPSRKRSRSTDSSEETEAPEAKQIATGSEKSAETDVNMTEDIEDDASEGEIIEETEVQESQDLASENVNQNYHSKQTEINAMRKRIAEMEQRQTLKRSQSHALSPTESPTGTPAFTQIPQTALISPLSRIPDQQSSSAKQDDRTSQPVVPLVKATPEQIAERAARLKADFLRQRALRQKQLQEGLPALNDEVTKSQNKLKESKSRLAQVQGELQQYEANILRARETERQIRQEIESLERSVSDGMSGQKQFSNELNELKQQTKNNVATEPENSMASTGNQVVSTVIDEPSEQRKTATPQPLDSIKVLTEDAGGAHDSVMHMSGQLDETNANTTRDADENLSKSAQSSAVAEIPTSRLTPPESVVDSTVTENENVHRSPQTSLPVDKSAVASVSDTDDSDGMMDESDDADSDDSHMSIDEASDDSASMSNSDSEEYEPAEPEEVLQPYTKSTSEDYEPELANAQHYDDVQEDEGDEYEPADDMSIDNGSSTASTSAFTQAVSETKPTQDNHPVETSIPGLSHDVPHAFATDESSKVEDQEKGSQLSEANALTKVQGPTNFPDAEELRVLGDDNLSSTRYVPYQSPLSSFKSYRFHPFFSEQVKDGYRSLTYSHKIDSKLPICLKELEGEPCTDPDCQDQHFGSMALSDDKILVQMSSANDIKDKGLRDQYLLGLKQVIARLRQEGVKEFSAVASALSQYRREWTVSSLNGP